MIYSKCMFALLLILGISYGCAFIAPLNSFNKNALQCQSLKMSSQTLMSEATSTHTVEGRKIGGPLTPISNFILVKDKAAKSATAGGIILPDQSQEKPTEGIAVSCGPGKVHQETGVEIPMPIKAGDSVIYGKFDGTKVEYDGTDHTLIRDDDVLVVYNGDDVTLENLRLIRDQVLVKIEKRQEATASGIVIAQSAAEQEKRPSFGKVIAFGEGRVANNGNLIPMPIEVGETVKYRDYAGSEIKINGEDYLVIKMIDVLAKWKEE